jgi:ketosteroid isomerase-like protein
MSTPTAAAFDLAALGRAIEQRDAAGQLALYAPDAEVRLVDKIATPGSPRILRGRDEIAAWIEDVCARDMTHRIEQPVVGDGRAAFVENCHYADGTNVLCVAVLELADGRIVRQTAVQAWDE